MGGILHLRSWGCWRNLESYASHTGCWWKKPICWETAEKSRQEKPQPLSGAALSPGCFWTASLPLPSVALGNRCLTQQASAPDCWASLPPPRDAPPGPSRPPRRLAALPPNQAHGAGLATPAPASAPRACESDRCVVMHGSTKGREP